jgi:hypothetical protein
MFTNRLKLAATLTGTGLCAMLECNVMPAGVGSMSAECDRCVGRCRFTRGMNGIRWMRSSDKAVQDEGGQEGTGGSCSWPGRAPACR